MHGAEDVNGFAFEAIPDFFSGCAAAFRAQVVLAVGEDGALDLRGFEPHSSPA